MYVCVSVCAHVCVRVCVCVCVCVCVQGDGVPRDMATAFDLLEDAVNYDGSHMAALNDLAVMYLNGVPVYYRVAVCCSVCCSVLQCVVLRTRPRSTILQSCS